MAQGLFPVYEYGMQRLLRVFGVGVFLVAAAGCIVWLAWEPLLDVARRRLEPLLAEALHMPVHIGDARLTMRPLRLDIADVSLGEAGAVLRIRDGRLTIRVGESIRRREPVADLVASQVDVAPLGFAERRTDAAHKDDTAVLPRFSLRRVRVDTVRVVLPAPDAPFVITAAQVTGRIGVGEGGLLETQARARGVAVARGDRALAVDSLRGRLEIKGKDVVIRSATADGPDVDVHVSYDRQRRRHQVRAAVNVAALAVIDPVLREIEGQVAVDGTITGRLDMPTVDAHVQTPRLVAFDQEIVDIDARLRWHGKEKEVELIAGRARHATGSYVVAGNLIVDDARTFTAKADWQYASAASAPGTGGEKLPPLTASAAAVARGTLTPLRLTAELHGSAGRSVNANETVQLTAQASFADGVLQAQASATQARGNTIDASLSMDRAGQLDGVIRTSVGHVPSWQALLGTPVTPQVEGVLTAEIRVGGTRAQPQLAGTVQGKDLTLFGASITTVDADVRSEGALLNVDRLLIRLTRGSLMGEGTFGLRQDAHNDWRLVVEDVPTQTIAALVAATTGADLPLWGGQLGLRATGSGTWSAVGVRADLQIDDFYLSREPIDRVTVSFESTWPQWAADGRLERGPSESLSLVASGRGADSLSASLQSSRWDLSRVQTTNRLGMRGAVEISATAEGPPAALSGHVRVAGAAIEVSGRALGEIALDAEGRQGSWRLQGKIGELMAAAGTFETRGDLPLRATVEWRDADLAPLLRPDANVRIDSSGALRLQLSLRAVDRLTGTLQVDRLDVVSAEQAAPLLSVAEPIVIVATGGRFDLRAVRLRGTGTALTADGWFTSSGECDIGIDGRSDLALVELLSPAVYAARGNAVVSGRARRQGRGPLQLTGTATLERVAFDFGQPWVAVNVNGHMTFRDSVMDIDTLTGRLAGGTFAIGGLIDVMEGPQLTWTATELAPAVLPDVEAELSGSGSIRGSWSDLTVAGEIEVLRALYDRRFAITDLIPLFQRQLASPPTKEPAQTVVRLNLHIVAPDEIFVDNNVATIEMRTDLALTGTTDNVVIAGPIEVLSGEVTFRGRTFTLETGVVEFRPELGRQAYLNINARTVVPTARASYTVDTHIVGTTDNYQVTFSSDDPALSQTDLLSLVTFGKTSSELQQSGGGVSVNDLVALAPGLYQDQAQEQAQALLGIDRIDLEPGYSKSTGLYEPRVTLGKNLTRDLTASLSSTFGIRRRQQVQLEYHVSPRVSLLADWESASTDQAGAFAGEVKFRYPFRTFPGWTALLPWPGEDVQ